MQPYTYLKPRARCRRTEPITSSPLASGGERGLSADHWETRGHYITGSSPEASHKKRGAVAVWQAGNGPCVSWSRLMLANVAHNHTHTHTHTHTQVRWRGTDGLTQCHDTHNLRPSAYHAPINEQSYVTLWDCKVSSVITAGIFISHQTPIFILISVTTVPPCHHSQKCHCTLTEKLSQSFLKHKQHWPDVTVGEVGVYKVEPTLYCRDGNVLPMSFVCFETCQVDVCQW